MAGAALHPLDVHVDGEDVLVEREAAHRRGRVRADAGKRRQVVGPAVTRDRLGGAVEIDGAPVVSQPLPLSNHVGCRRCGERLGRRPALEPREVPGHDAVDLRLLEHDLGHEDRVRVARPSPGQVARVGREPLGQQSLHRYAVEAAARSCFEKYVSAAFVFVSCLPSRLTPFSVRYSRDSAATWNASEAEHFVDSSRMREPSG